MTSDEADEVLSIVKRICPVVMSSAIDTSGNAGTALRRCVGMMHADFNMIDLTAFGVAFSLSIDLARHCKATLVTIDRVRKAALAEKPMTLPAVQTVLAMVRLTLACEARIISFMKFKSREEVDALAVQMHAAFSQASEVAADDLDAGIYMQIIRLHGDVTRHLADRGRILPRVVAYNHQVVMPALRMAQRAYGDASRYQELIDENDVVHPAFMPMQGKMLAVQ
jgi:hypothetical protein